MFTLKRTPDSDQVCFVPKLSVFLFANPLLFVFDFRCCNARLAWPSCTSRTETIVRPKRKCFRMFILVFCARLIVFLI